jgi:predicted nuclease of predicted toxin-antitoxin system
VAVRDVGLGDAPDDEILDHAAVDDRIVISHDTDFGTLLAFRRLTKPSFVLIRSSDPLAPEEQAAMLIANLDVVAEDLRAGAIIVFARGHLRSRPLPVRADRAPG